MNGGRRGENGGRSSGAAEEDFERGEGDVLRPSEIADSHNDETFGEHTTDDWEGSERGEGGSGGFFGFDTSLPPGKHLQPVASAWLGEGLEVEGLNDELGGLEDEDQEVGRERAPLVDEDPLVPPGQEEEEEVTGRFEGENGEAYHMGEQQSLESRFVTMMLGAQQQRSNGSNKMPPGFFSGDMRFGQAGRSSVMPPSSSSSPYRGGAAASPLHQQQQHPEYGVIGQIPSAAARNDHHSSFSFGGPTASSVSSLFQQMASPPPSHAMMQKSPTTREVKGMVSLEDLEASLAQGGEQVHMRSSSRLPPAQPSHSRHHNHPSSHQPQQQLDPISALLRMGVQQPPQRGGDAHYSSYQQHQQSLPPDYHHQQQRQQRMMAAQQQQQEQQQQLIAQYLQQYQYAQKQQQQQQPIHQGAGSPAPAMMYQHQREDSSPPVPSFSGSPASPSSTSSFATPSSPTSSSSEQSFQPYFVRQKFVGRTDMMSNYDINTVLRLHSSQLQTATPFLDDYYYQAWLIHKQSKAHYQRLLAQQQNKAGNEHAASTPQLRIPAHTALCETPPRPPRKKNPIDPFKDCLGRIPSHSVRAPRQLVELDSNIPLSYYSPEKGEHKRREEEGEEEQGMRRYSLPLRAEEGFNILLDIEDVDLLLSSSATTQDPQSSTRLLQKRRLLVEELFRLLRVCTTSPEQVLPAPRIANNNSGTKSRSSPANKEDDSASDEEDESSEEEEEEEEEIAFNILEEDKAFVQFLRLAKGSKLVARALPLLLQHHVYFILIAYIRNLHAIVTTPKTKEEIQACSQLSFVVVRAINSFLLSPLIACLQTFLIHSQVEAIKTKNGVLVLKALFTRAHQLLSQLKRLPPQQQAEYAELKQWDEAFGSFMKGLSGYFCALLRLSAEEEQQQEEEEALKKQEQSLTAMAEPSTSIFVGMAHVWDFLLLLTLLTNRHQNELLFHEIKEVIEESLEEEGRHHAVIHALLQQLGKAHLFAPSAATAGAAATPLSFLSSQPH